MEKIAIKATKREIGTKAAKVIRRQGLVPAVYYKHGEEAISITLDPKELKQFVYTKEVKLAELNIEGENKPCPAYLKEVKFHPVTDEMIHCDFLGLDEDKKMEFVVPIRIVGTSEGVRKGGILQQNLFKMKVKCLPKDLVPFLEVDITPMLQGDVIQVANLKSDTLDFVLPPSTTIVQVAQSRVQS